MALKLENATLADRASIAEIITLANMDDPYGKTVWPGSTVESRIAGSYARLPSSMLGEGASFMKVTLDGEAIAYSQWTLPLPIWEKLNKESGGGIHAEIDTALREKLLREGDDSCTEEGWPRGMRVEVVQSCSPAMGDARSKAFPQNEKYIMLDQVKTLPGYQRRGAGALLVEWGIKLADREGLKICLESTEYGLPLYTKLGFRNVYEVHHDVSSFGGPSRYTHTFMVKDPKG